MKLTTEEAAKFRGSVMAACNAIKENTEEINQLDTGCGDGDTGSTLASLADGMFYLLVHVAVSKQSHVDLLINVNIFYCCHRKF